MCLVCRVRCWIDRIVSASLFIWINFTIILMLRAVYLRPLTSINEKHKFSSFSSTKLVLFLCNLCSSQIVLSFTKLTVRLNILLKLPHKLSQVWTIISIHRKFELVKRVISVSTHSQTVIENELWTLQGSNLRPLPCRGSALPAELKIRNQHLLYQVFLKRQP